MQRRTFSLAVASAVLTGCATRGSIEDDAAVKSGEGLIALRIDAAINGNLTFDKFVGERTTLGEISQNFGHRGQFILKEREIYFVRSIEAGEFMWSRFYIFGKFASFGSSNKFIVKPDVINYNGHLRISTSSDRAHIAVTDSEADMRAYLEKNFPRFARKYRFEKSLSLFRLPDQKG